MPSRSSAAVLIAAASLTLVPMTPTGAQTLAEWLGPVDGDWNDPINWSSALVPDNVGGTTYEVLIAAGGSSDYTVYLHTNEAYVVDSLTLNDPFATLNIELADLTADVLDIRAGKLFTRGDIFGAQVIATGAVTPIDWEVSGTTTLYDLRFSADTAFFGEINSRLTIEDALFLDDGVVLSSDVDTLRFEAGTTLNTDGQATLYLLDDMEVRNGVSAPLQIGSGVTIEIASNRVEIEGAMEIYGTIRAAGTGVEGTLTINNNPDGVVNYGVIEAINGAQLNVYNSYQQGILRADATSEIQLGNTRWGSGAEIQGGGSFVFSSGTFDLDGNTLELNLDAGGQFLFYGGSIKNGTITGNTISALEIGSSSGAGITFEDMTFGVDVRLDQRFHTVTDGLTLMNNAVIESRSGSGTIRLRFDEAQTVTGNGRIRFGSGSGGILQMDQASGSIFFDTGIFIDALSGSGIIGNGTQRWVNRGTMAVGSNQTLTLDGDWENEGTLILENNSNLSLQGFFRTDSLGTVLNQGGQIIVDGELDNEGDVLDLLFLPGEVVLGDGTIRGGVVRSSGNSTLILSDVVRFHQVTLDLTPTLAQAVIVTESIILNDDFQFLAIEGAGGMDAGFHPIDGDGDGFVHIGGTGTVTFAGDPETSWQDPVGFADTSFATYAGIVIDPGLLVLLDDADVEVEFAGRQGFINRGTISLQAGAATFEGGWSNEGIIQVSGTADVTLGGSYTTADLLSIDYLGGTVTLTDELDNTGATLIKNNASFWEETSLIWYPALSITGGRVETADGLSLTNIRGLNGVELAGDLWLSRFEFTQIQNGLTLDGGTLHVIGRDTSLLSGDLMGTGTIRFDDSGVGLPALAFQNTVTVSAGIEFQTGNMSGTIGSSGIAWVNLGSLVSSNPGLELRVDGDLDHLGAAHAVDGGVITFDNLTNRGTLLAEYGGLLRLENGWTNPTGLIDVRDGGVLAVEGWSAMPGAILLDAGVVRIEFDTDLPGLVVMPQEADSYLDVAGGLALDGGVLDLDSFTSTLRLDGGTISIGSVVGAQPLEITNALSQDSTLDNVLIQTDVVLGDTGTTHLRNGTRFSGSTVTGNGTLLIDSGSITFDGTTIDSAVVIERGSTLSILNGVSLDGQIRSGAGSGALPQLNIEGPQTLSGAGRISSDTVAGLQVSFTGDLVVGTDLTLNATVGTLRLTGAGQTLDLAGTLEVDSGRQALLTAGTWNNLGSTVVEASGLLSVTASAISNFGTLDLRNAVLSTGGTDITNAESALLVGSGSLNLGQSGTLHQSGDLEIVDTASTHLMIFGNLDTRSSATTSITFEDGHAETFAYLEATGDVVLDGVLRLDSESLTFVEAGDTQTLVLGETLTGTFAGVIGLSIDAMYSWHLEYQGDRLLATARLSGDTDGDGVVGISDLDFLLANWGTAAVPGNTLAGEWTGDGVVGAQDLQVVLDHWGNTTPPADGNVPEPGTLAITAFTFLALLRRRDRAALYRQTPAVR